MLFILTSPNVGASYEKSPAFFRTTPLARRTAGKAAHAPAIVSRRRADASAKMFFFSIRFSFMT